MFEFKPETLAYFAEHNTPDAPIALFSPDDLAEIERLWGYKLPPAYGELMMSVGPAPFPDEGQSQAEYTYSEGDMSQTFVCTFTGCVDMEALRLMRQYLIEDADNLTEEPFIPPNMLPFGADPGQNLFLLELGTDTPRVWFWEDSPDAWGTGDNKRLGFVADDLVSFINGLT